MSTDALVRRSWSRKAQALVEFSLILPIFLVLIFAIFDWGYYLFVTVSVNHANRAAVRKAAMNNVTRSQIRDIVVNSAVGVALSKDDVQITTAAHDTALPGGPPSVTIVTSFNHRFFAPSLMGRDSMAVHSQFKSIVTTYLGRPAVTF